MFESDSSDDYNTQATVDLQVAPILTQSEWQRGRSLIASSRLDDFQNGERDEEDVEG